jgi:chitinase
MGQTCSYILVNEGDTCASLAAECNITAAEFTQYNPSSTLCSTLVPKEPVCCSSGSLPDLTPQPNSDGTCYAYTVQSGDYCQLIASNNYITVDDIETYNAQTWGWMGCDDIQLNATICLSTGTPPMPAVVSGALCGPQVSGTQRPSDWSDIASLNPCPLNACVGDIPIFSVHTFVGSLYHCFHIFELGT